MKKLITLFFCLFFFSFTHSQYCNAPHSVNCSANDNINLVKIIGTSLNNSSGCGSITSTGYSRYAPSGNYTATLYRGITYYAQIAITATNTRSVSMWIDFNGDDSLGKSEWYRVVASSTSGTFYVPFTIPTNAALDTVRFRIRSRASASPNGDSSACITFGSGESEDYTVTIDSLTSCSSPVAGNADVNNDTVCGSSVFYLFLYGNSFNSGTNYQWQYSDNQTSWFDITGANDFIAAVTQLNSSYYRCLVSCGGNTDSTTNTLYVYSKPVSQCYCLAIANLTDGPDIGRVEFGKLSNGTDTLPATFNSTARQRLSDFTSLTPVDFYPGMTYKLKVTQIDSAAFTTCRVQVFIDWNHDASLPPASERVMNKTTMAGLYGNSVEQFVTIPTNAVPGLTYMRVILSSGTTTPTQCALYTRGETENYLINILKPAKTDIGTLSVISPVTNISSCGGIDSQDVLVRVKNMGKDTIWFGTDTLFVLTDISDGKNSFTLQKEINTGYLSPGLNLDVTVGSFISFPPGYYSISASSYIKSDTVNFNDTASTYIYQVLPHDTITASNPYFQTFENGNEGWMSGGTASTWTMGNPSKTTITGAGGGKTCWTTGGLYTGTYAANERSWVMSPCFDLSGLTHGKSYISADIWWNTQQNNDGAALQYSLDGTNWATIGLKNDPINWYNSSTFPTLASLRTFFGNNLNWWSGRDQTFSGSGGWIPASHILPDSALTANTRFRIIFGANGATQDDGFAFDNFRIFEKQSRDIALSQMISPYISPCASANENIIVRLVNNGFDTIVLSKDSIIVTSYISGSLTDTFSITLNSGSIFPGDFMDVTVTNTLNLSASGSYTLLNICSMQGDLNVSNDTLIKNVKTASPKTLPYRETFNVPSLVPTQYINGGFTNTAGTGTAGTYGLRGSMTATINLVRTTSPVVGTATPLTALFFNYRLSDTLNQGDSIYIQVSGDCGQNYQTIYILDSSNTIPLVYQNLQLDLGNFVGHDVRVRIDVSSDNGYIWQFNLDNLTIADKPDMRLDTVHTCQPVLLDADPVSQGYGVTWNNGASGDTITVFNSGNYIATAIDSLGLINTDTATVIFYQSPTVALINDTSICNSNSINLSAGNYPNNYSFKWNTGDTTSNITSTGPGVYTVKVITPGGCFGEDTVTITAIPALTGVIIIPGKNYTGTTNGGTLTNYDQICIGGNIEYTFTPPNGLNNSDYSIKWLVKNYAVKNYLTGNIVSGVVSFSAPSQNNGTLQWNPVQGHQDSIYVFIWEISNLITGCDTMYYRYIYVSEGARVDLGQDVNGCPGTSFNISGGNFKSYKWNTGDTTQSITINTPGTYILQISDSNNCSATDTLIFTGLQSIPQNLGNDTFICPGISVKLSANTAMGAHLAWNTGDTVVSVNVNSAGLYSISCTSADGCVSTDSIEIGIFNSPDAGFNAVLQGTNTWQFTPLITTYPFYDWNFGDLTSSGLTSPAHTYVNSGTYKVILTVKDSNSCNDSSEKSVVVNLGILQPVSNHSIYVYPTPASEYLYINGIVNSGYEILDLNGRKVLIGVVGNIEPIDIRTLPSGIFYLRLNDNQYSENILRVIIVR